MLRRKLVRKSREEREREMKERQEKKATNPVRSPDRSPVRIGTIVERALKLVGITPERVQTYFKDCGCRRRRDKMNKISDIAWSVLRGKMTLADARREFDRIAEGKDVSSDVTPQEGK